MIVGYASAAPSSARIKIKVVTPSTQRQKDNG